MVATSPIVLRVEPGIKRDGTQIEGNAHVDGLWCRWQRGKPRKMWGYTEALTGFTGAIRGLGMQAAPYTSIIHTGHTAGLERAVLALDGTAASGVTDRSPAGFVSYPDILWTFDYMYDAGGTESVIIAHPGRNGICICDDNDQPIYYGAAAGTGALTAIGGSSPSVSGGVVVLRPFLMAFGNDGYVSWSDTNTPATWGTGASGSARVCQDKLIIGRQVRGGPTNSPTGLLWSITELLRVSFSGTSSTTFKFDIISNQITVLSSSCVVEVDGKFFWPGVGQFFWYNGSVQELPNDKSLNWFFDNLNWSYRQRVWGHKRARWGEIWWYFPYGSATECTHALIYNYRENCWYDTELPDGGRYCAAIAGTMRYPVAIGTQADSNGKYSMWVEEKGRDRVSYGGASAAIRSYYETCDISFATGDLGKGADRWTRIDRVEPDFLQSGDMRMTVRGRKWPRASTNDPADRSFDFSDTDDRIDVNQQRRFLRLRFESNTLGGDYQQGTPLLHLAPGDARQ